MLYIVSTPIGNLSDISLRALEILKSCDLILCEDTRHSGILLRHYGIETRLESYHKFNEAIKREKIANQIREGTSIALISDAGTPGIADPGVTLIQLCLQQGLPLCIVPGPCALIQALIGSGLSTERFQFCGFLPRKQGELRQALIELLQYPGTTICYEAPSRILDTLAVIATLQPQRQVVVAREMTKVFEEYVRGTVEEVQEHLKRKGARGEMVLLLSPPSSNKKWTDWTISDHIQWVEEHYGLSRKEAIKLVAELRGVPKRTIYQEGMKVNEDS